MNFGGFGYRLENGYRVCWLTQRGEKVVKEMEEQAEKLMVQRVKELREEDKMRTSKTYDLELKEQVDRMERILYSLSEEDRAWLDAQLTDKFCIVEAEARELYLGGFRDAIRLLMSVGI